MSTELTAEEWSLIDWEQIPIAEAKKLVINETVRLMQEGGADLVESLLLDCEQSALPAIHRFGPGVYIREVELPAGCVCVGHEQKYHQQNIMLSGRITMISANGTYDLVAPACFVGGPGRKVGLVHEPVVWLNVWPTDEQDIEKLENTYIKKSPESVAAINAARMSYDAHFDREDYLLVLREFGFTEEEVQTQVQYTGDMTKLPFGAYKFKVASSPIHGRGVFATARIAERETIGCARVDGKRTIIGRMVNHSRCPNSEFVECDNGDLYLVAKKVLGGCMGGYDGEEITIDYRHALRLSQPSREVIQ